MIDVAAPSTLKEKDAAIELALSDITKEYGEGAVMRMAGEGKQVPCVPTGIYAVDYGVIGVGGMPKGRIIEIFGTEGGGKTTLALRTIASAQRAGGRAAFIDVEHALDPTWAGKNGVIVPELLVSQPDYGEQALDVTARLLESMAFDVIVVDSVAALIPKRELEGDFGDSHVGLQARLMSQAMRKLTAIVSRSNCVLIFINQIREKIGVQFGSPETTTGGRALRFYSSLRLDVRRIKQVKVGEENIGNVVKIRAAKNKVSSPFREAEVDLLFDRGFDAEGSLFDAAVAAKIVEKSGSWYAYAGERLGQGKCNAIEAMRPHSEDILKKVLEVG
jgi:recombination protein RecA